MRLILAICFISIGYVSAQYQDNYESNNVNPYPRSNNQYDSGENAYSPPTRAAVQSYPTRSNLPSSYSNKPKVSCFFWQLYNCLLNL